MHIRALTWSRLAAVFVIACVGIGDRSAVAHTELDALRTQLVDHTGEEYLKAREAALALPDAMFEDLMRHLEAADPTSITHVLATALTTRRTHPAVAVEFDEHPALEYC